MRRILINGGPFLAACLAVIGLPPAFADTTTVTTKTTTVETSPSLLLPASSYVLVDPLSGVVKGDYIVGSRIFEGTPLSGNFVVMDKVTRRLVGTFDANGNLIALSTAPAATEVAVSVESHRARLEREINEMLAKGQISGSQAAGMRLDIAQLFPDKDQPVTSKSVTYSSVLAADSGLYTVESRLLPLVQKSYTSTVIRPRFVSVNGQIMLPDSLDYRRLQLERRIEDEFAFGHLTKNQLISLKSDITDIANREARYKANGVMKATNAAVITADLNALQARLDRDVASVDAGHPL